VICFSFRVISWIDLFTPQKKAAQENKKLPVASQISKKPKWASRNCLKEISVTTSDLLFFEKVFLRENKSIHKITRNEKQTHTKCSSIYFE